MVVNSRHNIRTFAIRRISPFLGTWHILETPAGRAVTGNGLLWQVQVNVRLNSPQWGSLDRKIQQNSFCLFGNWKQESGLDRVPINPYVDLQEANEKAMQVVEELERTANLIPFPLLDRFELWLLDRKTSQPVIMVRSMESEDKLPQKPRLNWNPFDVGKQDVEALQRILERKQISLSLREVYEKLIRVVRLRCGVPMAAQWFERDAQGGGRGLKVRNTDPDLEGRYLKRNSFPLFLHMDDWPGESDRELMQAYLEWLSPALLHLRSITDEQRRVLEQQACNQPISLFDHVKLFPKIIDQDRINVALVEAIMRKANCMPV